MSNYKEYKFTIGDSPTRIYKGLRMSPKPHGFEFGLVVYNELMDVQSHLNKSGIKDKNILQLCIEALEVLDYKKTIEKWNFILSTQGATISASEDQTVTGSDKKTYILSDEKMYNEWFEKYPQDLVEVMYSCIFENAAPFLPVSQQEMMKLVKQSFEDEKAAKAQAELASPSKST